VFETQKMATRLHRRIRSKTARDMLTWSHYSFRQRLLHKAREFPGCHIHIATEEYTSKTCGQCGILNAKLGGSKVFCCGQCGYTADRDANAARHILLLKFLTEMNEPGSFPGAEA
jgi:putative transposase